MGNVLRWFCVPEEGDYFLRELSNLVFDFYPLPVGEGEFLSRQDSVRRLESGVMLSCERKNLKTTG